MLHWERLRVLVGRAEVLWRVVGRSGRGLRGVISEKRGVRRDGNRCVERKVSRRHVLVVADVGSVHVRVRVGWRILWVGVRVVELPSAGSAIVLVRVTVLGRVGVVDLSSLVQVSIGDGRGRMSIVPEGCSWNP